ncbi:hypothetical protein RRU01S_22_00080 [Agrobacterium rubi TR3 = NBRC 13261]|uniref:Methyltransferase domain-containing protein n=2 Tax=Agrobacterium rubi TaxID=28099 RepID=A0A081CYX9_9HYPH|nr:hypothetical protein RRU01S_22_00080 [Agrobacterium rubi TR3 = NBRC 13261]
MKSCKARLAYYASPLVNIEVLDMGETLQHIWLRIGTSISRLLSNLGNFCFSISGAPGLRAAAKNSKDDNSDSKSAAFNQYEMRLPHAQNAIDTLDGWTSAFPIDGLNAGNTPLFADDRVIGALNAYGAVEGLQLLEVGPLEGMHTFILNQHRPANIDVIEANKSCFLRCLVTKEILKLDRASFYLGDIQEWLRVVDRQYDFALASGVLYHMPDPGEFLRLLSVRANSLFIWTHYYDDTAMPVQDVRRKPFSGNVETRSVSGMDVNYYERSYQHAEANASFCGGMKDRHYWLQRDEILDLLKHLGYSEVVVQDEYPEHPGGPCFSVFARR